MQSLICFLFHNLWVIALIAGAWLLALILLGLVVVSVSVESKEEVRRIGYDARRMVDETSDDYLMRIRQKIRR